ncbi:MAG: hypothetical protein ABII00_19220 [Elusimicrobiota bacterium]
MTYRRWLLLTSLIAFGLGCSKAEAPVMPGPGRLERAVQAAQTLPPCDTVIPMELPATWPVPTGQKGGSEFKVLFYPFTGTPVASPTVYAPVGEAILDLETGKPSACERWPGHGNILSKRRWPEGIQGLSVDEFDKLAARLYDATEQVAALYVTEYKPTGTGLDLMKRYLALFESLAEPDLLPYYYRMNPDFWEWLRGVLGKSIPPAK